MKKSTVDISARLNPLAGSGLVERLVREEFLAISASALSTLVIERKEHFP